MVARKPASRRVSVSGVQAKGPKGVTADAADD